MAPLRIETVIAGGNREFTDYIIRWIAWLIQNPDRQAEVALVLIGEKGSGKGTLAECLQRIFGLHAFQVSSSDEVIGRFNGHLQDTVLLIADEAFWGDKYKYKQCAGRLQAMITEPRLAIEPKGIGIFQIRNCLHILMLDFTALHRQIADGGAEAMFHELQRMPLGDWHPREIPASMLHGAALQKQQSLAMPPLEQWYLGLLHDGVLPGASAKRPNFTLTSNLRDQAKDRIPRLRWDLTDVGLANFLDEESGKGVGNICTKARTSAANGWSFPPLAEARARWVRTYGPVKWHNPVAEWRPRRSQRRRTCSASSSKAAR